MQATTFGSPARPFQRRRTAILALWSLLLGFAQPASAGSTNLTRTEFVTGPNLNAQENWSVTGAIVQDNFCPDGSYIAHYWTNDKFYGPIRSALEFNVSLGQITANPLGNAGIFDRNFLPGLLPGQTIEIFENEVTDNLGVPVGAIDGELFLNSVGAPFTGGTNPPPVLGFFTANASYLKKPCASCNCTPGTVSTGLHSAHLKISLGRGSAGHGESSLFISADALSPQLVKADSVAPQLLGEDIVKISGLAIKQVLTRSTLAILIESSDRLDFNLYRFDDQGALANGYYVPTAAPYKTVSLVRSVAQGIETLTVLEKEGTEDPRTSAVYTWNPATLEWTYDRDSVHLYLHNEWDATATIRTETREGRDAAGTVTSRTIRTFNKTDFGEQLAVEKRPDGLSGFLTTSYAYYDATAGPGRKSRVKLRVDQDGHWESYDYDSAGRPTRVTSQVGDTAPPVVPATPDLQNRTITTTYDGVAPAPQVLETESYGGMEVRRVYRKYTPQQVQEIVCRKPGAAWDDVTNEVTITHNYAAGEFAGQTQTIQRPDGTGQLFGYSHTDATGQADPTLETTVVGEGVLNGTLDGLTEGTQTTSIKDRNGNLVYEAVADISSSHAGAPIVLSTKQRTTADSAGRPTTYLYDDGTTETMTWGCCGLITFTDRAGVLAQYDYDANRQFLVSRAGLDLFTYYDSDDHVVRTVRQPTGAGAGVDLATAAYDLAGRLIQTTERPINQDIAPLATSYVESSVGGHKVRTITTPVGQRIETYLQDGQLLNVTGNASRPAGYVTTAEALSRGGETLNCLVTKETKLDSAGAETAEWVTTYRDGAGRILRGVSPGEGPAPAAVADRFYQNGTPAGAMAAAAGRLVKAVDPDGVTTLYAYDVRGELQMEALDLAPPGGARNGVIDLAGSDRVTSTTREVVTEAGRGTLLRTTVRQWQQDGVDSSVVVQQTDISPNGRFVRSTRFGLASVTEISLVAAGSTKSVTTLPDLSTAEEWTTQDRVTKTVRKDSGGVVLSQQDMLYDPQGRLQTSTDLRNGATDYTYYADDRVWTVTTPAADAQSARQVTTYTYAANGRKATEMLPDNGVVNYTYWPTGELRRQWGARIYPVEYTYDAQGRPRSLTTWQDFNSLGGAAVTTWNYDPASGRLLNKKYADGKGPSYTYTAAGRLKTRTWQRGVVTTYGYDPNSGDGNGTSYSDTTPSVGMLRDRAGRPYQVTDAAGTRTLTYTVDGQLDLEDFGATGMFSGIKIDPGYDALQRRTSLTATQGQAAFYAVGYTPDNASRLGTVTFGAETATYAYEPQAANLVRQISFQHAGAANLTTTKTYDKLYRLTSTSTANVAVGQSAVLSSFTYAYNGANQRTQATLEDATYWSYGYDPLGQVTSGAKYLADSTPALGRQFGYAYDDIGNRKSTVVNGRTASYTPNLLNQYQTRQIPPAIDVSGEAAPDATVTVNQQPTARQGRNFYKALPADNSAADFSGQVKVVGVKNNSGPAGEDAIVEDTRAAVLPKTPEAFVYDDDGNLFQDAQWTYTWNAENQLVKMESRQGLPAATPIRKLEFIYDYLHRRIEKRSWQANVQGTFAEQPTKVNAFIYDGWNLAAEMDASGALIRSYAWGLDTSGTSREVGGGGGLLFEQQVIAEESVAIGTYATAYDGNGNVVLLLNAANGSIQAQFEYGSFGELARNSGPLGGLPFNYSTQYCDQETGLLYFGYRYYNPRTARWVSKDPIEEAGGFSLYAMLNNQALSHTDILGLGAALPNFDPSDPCLEFLEKLKLFARILATRYHDLQNDTLGLFGSCEATPVAKGGRGTWQGHVDQYDGQRRHLQRQIQNYLDRCGNKVPVFVYMWAQRPAPATPTCGVTFMDNVLLNIPGSDATWETIGKTSEAVGVGALVIAGGVIVAPIILSTAGATEGVVVITGVAEASAR